MSEQLEQIVELNFTLKEREKEVVLLQLNINSPSGLLKVNVKPSDNISELVDIIILKGDFEN